MIENIKEIIVDDFSELKDFGSIRTVDLALKNEDETMEEFTKRIFDEKLGIEVRYKAIKT